MMKFMNRKHPGNGNGNGNSDVDEDEDQQSMGKIEGTQTSLYGAPINKQLNMQTQ